MLILKSTFKIIDEKAQEWLDKIIILSAKTKLEEGCLNFSVLQNPFKKNEFIIMEEWESHNCINLHFENKEYWNFLNSINEFSVDKPIIHLYEVSSKELI